MSEIAVQPNLCGNWHPGGHSCPNTGLKYCGEGCQKSHWPVHKNKCRSPMAKEAWRPAWECEGREPSWAMGREATNAHNPFGGYKYLWGNTPAVDVLRIDRNEGHSWRQNIALLFAALGTQVCPASCPDGYAPDIADAMIHIWYSAFFPPKILFLLQQVLRPLVVDVCDQIVPYPPNKKLGRTWDFSGTCSFRLVLTKANWLRLGKMLDGRECLHAAEMRTAVTLAESRTDYRDRWYFKEATPLMRIAKQTFQEDGILLPFGHPRSDYSVANPTLFADSTWPMDDKADPSTGWPIGDIQAVSLPASSDWYGKLYVYLHSLFQDFLALTIFLNAVKEMAKRDGDQMPNIDRVLDFLPPPQIGGIRFDISPDFTRLWDARDLVSDTSDAEKLFQRMLRQGELVALASEEEREKRDGMSAVALADGAICVKAKRGAQDNSRDTIDENMLAKLVALHIGDRLGSQISDQVGSPLHVGSVKAPELAATKGLWIACLEDTVYIPIEYGVRLVMAIPDTAATSAKGQVRPATCHQLHICYTRRNLQSR
ncbi:hypothetical protein PWT90_03512 [Aphanocladium album]|nr:hypothetical protein PWT90_03512 [Aphanocladium album]